MSSHLAAKLSEGEPVNNHATIFHGAVATTIYQNISLTTNVVETLQGGYKRALAG